jgi:Zn-dependent protease
MGPSGSWNPLDPYGQGDQSSDRIEIHYGPYSGTYLPYEPPKVYTFLAPGGRKFTFTDREVKELFISIGVLTFAFSMVLGGPEEIVAYLIPSFIAVFTGFFLHEMGHKFVAQSYGLISEFRMSMQGLMLAFITSLLGFLIAAPGAVEIIGYPSKEQRGKTALAGPGVNIAICIIALPFVFLDDPIGFTAGLVMFINSFLGLFNLIPVHPLDGEKIINWSPLHYVAAGILALGFFIGSFLVF